MYISPSIVSNILGYSYYLFFIVKFFNVDRHCKVRGKLSPALTFATTAKRKLVPVLKLMSKEFDNLLAFRQYSVIVYISSTRNLRLAVVIRAKNAIKITII